jgi:hypothetical protein
MSKSWKKLPPMEAPTRQASNEANRSVEGSLLGQENDIFPFLTEADGDILGRRRKLDLYSVTLEVQLGSFI